MAEQMWATLQQVLTGNAKSTVLKPLGWLIGLTLVASVSMYYYRLPEWLAGTVGVLCIVSIVLYIIAYIYFAFTDKDALRSERYSIQKLAIQKGFIGDDQSGYIPIQSQRVPSLISPPVYEKGEEDAQ